MYFLKKTKTLAVTLMFNFDGDRGPQNIIMRAANDPDFDTTDQAHLWLLWRQAQQKIGA